MGMFQAESGFKALNVNVFYWFNYTIFYCLTTNSLSNCFILWIKRGMSSCNIFSTGTTKVIKSVEVTSDIGYKPNTAIKFKWNGKAAISTRKLQEMREEQRKKSRWSSSNNPI